MRCTPRGAKLPTTRRASPALCKDCVVDDAVADQNPRRALEQPHSLFAAPGDVTHELTQTEQDGSSSKTGGDRFVLPDQGILHALADDRQNHEIKGRHLPDVLLADQTNEGEEESRISVADVFDMVLRNSPSRARVHKATAQDAIMSLFTGVLGTSTAAVPSATNRKGRGLPYGVEGLAMAFTSSLQPRIGQGRAAVFGLFYAWSGFTIMWGFWISFVIFLADPQQLAAWWPLSTVDRGGTIDAPVLAAVIDIGLIGLFGLQHSLMARPWFKAWWASTIPAAFERTTYVHMANVTLFALIILWQPIPLDLWSVRDGLLRDVLWAAFAFGWALLFLGARSFGILELLGIRQMRSWADGDAAPQLRLKTGSLYRYLRHPMYWGVLLGLWATPNMTVGHALLAAGLTVYILIAIRFEERDLVRRFGDHYRTWRGSTAA